MENLQQYPPEKRAQMFLAELKGKCRQVIKEDSTAGAQLVGLFCEQFPDIPPMLDEIGKEAEGRFTRREMAAVETGKLFMDKFNRNFGYDSTAWEIGLTAETPDLKGFMTATAKLILGILGEEPVGLEGLDLLIEAHTSFGGLIEWTNIQSLSIKPSRQYNLSGDKTPTRLL